MNWRKMGSPETVFWGKFNAFTGVPVPGILHTIHLHIAKDHSLVFLSPH